MNKPMDWDSWKKTKDLALASRTGSSKGKVIPFNDAKATFSTSKTKAPVRVTNSTFPKCAHSHPALPIGGYKIYGGSCLDPVIKDADVYVGFERSMEQFAIYPWSGRIAFEFHIVDSGVPASIVEFRKLLVYLEDALKSGKKVHLGCIGGHGRTGLVLSALVMHMTGNKNATEYVRTHYCKKAVESQKQIDWLNKHFGIDKVAPSKVPLASPRYTEYEDKYYSALGVDKGFYSNRELDFSSSGVHGGRSVIAKSTKNTDTSGYCHTASITPVKVKGNVWGF